VIAAAAFVEAFVQLVVLLVQLVVSVLALAIRLLVLSGSYHCGRDLAARRPK